MILVIITTTSNRCFASDTEKVAISKKVLSHKSCKSKHTCLNVCFTGKFCRLSVSNLSCAASNASVSSDLKALYKSIIIIIIILLLLASLRIIRLIFHCD